MKQVSFCKWIAVILCMLLVGGLLSSCAKSDSMGAMDTPPEAPSVNIKEDYVGSSMSNSTDKSEIGDAMQDDGTESPEEGLEPKIIRTATVNAETKQFDEATGAMETMLKSLGGYIEKSSVRGQTYSQSGGNRYAEYTLRIPAEKLDEFLESAGEWLHITHSSTSASDVSNEYYDIEARLSVLETEREVLEGMLSDATTIDSMITIEKRLYDVIYEIESYKTMLKVYDSKVAYSTVTLTVSEVADLTVIREDDSFGSRFKTALTESWQNFIDFCKDFVIVLVYGMPTLLTMALAVAAIVGIVVGVKKKKRKKEKKDAVQNQSNVK